MRRTIGILALGVLALTSCSRTPSTKRVALDVVETFDDSVVNDDQKECMRERIDEYDNSALEAIGEAQENQALDFSDPDAFESATPELQQFVEDLRGCLTGGG